MTDAPAPQPYRSTPIFDEQTLPGALRREHRTKSGVWGVVRVLEGKLRLVYVEPPGKLLSNLAGRDCYFPTNHTSSILSEPCGCKLISTINRLRSPDDLGWGMSTHSCHAVSAGTPVRYPVLEARCRLSGWAADDVAAQPRATACRLDGLESDRTTDRRLASRVRKAQCMPLLNTRRSESTKHQLLAGAPTIVI